MREEEVIVDQLANEASIEAIVRKRTLEGEYNVEPGGVGAELRVWSTMWTTLTVPVFKSRCPFFVPGGSGKGWWDLAEGGRAGQGPEV
jgi:hypothetical protein